MPFTPQDFDFIANNELRVKLNKHHKEDDIGKQIHQICPISKEMKENFIERSKP